MDKGVLPDWSTMVGSAPFSRSTLTTWPQLQEDAFHSAVWPHIF
jgi:hypothetical protein